MKFLGRCAEESNGLAIFIYTISSIIKMSFETYKKRYLAELQKQEHNVKDKSKKGFLDAEIKELVSLINQKNNFYTTSSCAGRIILFRSMTSKKCDNEWIVVSHKKVDATEIISNLKVYLAETKIKTARTKSIIWLRYEPLILHVCAKTIEDAEKFLALARSVGFKRGGITAIKKRIMIEVNGVDRLDVPIGNDNKLLVDDKYLLFLLDEANKKLLANLERIGKSKECSK